jgi:thiosulfate dehydrogenase (quinone) large subunit
MTTTKARAIAALRILLGTGFLYAGLEKVFNFAGNGPFNAAGFLKFATGGAVPGSDPKAIVNPTHDFWVSLAGNASAVSAINVLVQAGEVAIGVALILGLATHFAGLMGALMMGLFYVANWSFGTGPFNEQFLYGVVALVLVAMSAGEYYGLDALIEKTRWVQHTPALRYMLG